MIDRKQDGCARHARRERERARERAPRKHNSSSKKTKQKNPEKIKFVRTLWFHASPCPLFDSLLADATSLTQAGKQNQKQNANGEAMQSQAP